MIKNVNTIEEYRNMDKSQMIVQAGKTVRTWFGIPKKDSNYIAT